MPDRNKSNPVGNVMTIFPLNIFLDDRQARRNDGHGEDEFRVVASIVKPSPFGEVELGGV